MAGKTFKYDVEGGGGGGGPARVSIVASFGGLLMRVAGEAHHLARVKLDQKVYALLRKSSKA